MAKKLRVKDLKRDAIAADIVHASEEAVHWAERYRRQLTLGGIGLAVVLAVWGGYSYWSGNRTAAAETHLGAALRDQQQLDNPPRTPDSKAVKPTWENVEKELRAAMEAGPGTAAALTAELELGVLQAHQGKPKDAVATLSGLASRASTWRDAPHVLAALASAQEDAGDLAGAEATLKKLEAGTWKNYPSMAASFALARFYERQHRTEDARAAYQKVAANGDISLRTFREQAKTSLNQLPKGPVAAAGASGPAAAAPTAPASATTPAAPSGG